MSCSAKLGKPLKSLGAPLSKRPLFTNQFNVKPFSVEPERSLFASVMVCVVGVDPSN
jgi:hypothetical protein